MLRSLLLLVVLLLPAISFAQEKNGHLTLVGGLSVPDSENTRTHFVYGVNGGISVTQFYGIGGYHYISNSLKGPNDGDFQYSMTGLEGRYYLTNGDKMVFLALRAGVGKINNNVSGVGRVFSPYHWGVASGYSIQFWRRLNVGIEGSFLAFGRSKTTSSGTAYELKPFHVINFLLVLALTL